MKNRIKMKKVMICSKARTCNVHDGCFHFRAHEFNDQCAVTSCDHSDHVACKELVIHKLDIVLGLYNKYE